MSKLKLPVFFVAGAMSLLFSATLSAQEVVSDSVSQLKIDQRITMVPVAAKKAEVVSMVASAPDSPAVAAPVITSTAAPVNIRSVPQVVTQDKPSVSTSITATIAAPVITPVMPQGTPQAPTAVNTSVIVPAKSLVPIPSATSVATSVTTKVAPSIAANNFDPSDANADVVGEGDQLLVTVFGQPDLSADIVVGANGIVTLPLVGTVDVRGKTGSEIAGIFAKKLEAGQYLIKPKVSVKVAAQVSRSFSVLGEVVRPGRFILQGNLSVLDALSLAGGVTPRADKNLRILRRNSQDAKAELTEYATVRLDFEDEKNNAQFGQKVLANDVLIVGQQKNFYVYGEVRRPGAYPMEDDMNVMRVLSIGGGVTDRGSTSRIIIHRKSSDGGLKEIPARISDVVLPGDVVFINERIF
ncbi:SLBB domain-containing protein [Undibacterium jejuense]|uniref:SLBB domain-containing protein n=1 Tax=Undibacterium jejuense TaxID=1344949 RepID=A0A923KPP3_9BURK|nr:SLBB domain-containing protein [Undibacterium jejuense]MBC3862319.1 SLBB domain-containing protein [Undibacterium jejuense]